MSEKVKTRPKDNAHCFKGNGRAFWLEKARGYQPKLVSGHGGTRVEYGLDTIDDMVQQNGGILAPSEDKLDAGKLYFRFISTPVFRKYGDGAFAGNWWLDNDTFQNLRVEASEGGTPLDKLAARRLAVPTAWSDCAFVACAMLSVPLYCWAGRGRLAHGDGSPDRMRATPNGGLYGDPSHLAIRQLFVPGSRDEIGRFFRLQGVRRARDLTGTFFKR